MKKEESKELQLLRSHKEETGLSYRRLGESLGVNGMTVYNWFRDHQQPSDMAKRLIRSYLLGGK